MKPLSLWDIDVTISFEQGEGPIVRFFFDSQKKGHFFAGKKNQIRYLSNGDSFSEIWVGLGSKKLLTEESLRCRISDLCAFLSPLQIESCTFCVDSNTKDFFVGLVQSLFLSSYRFSYKKKSSIASRLNKVHIYLESSVDLDEAQAQLEQQKRLCQSVCLTRNLVSENASTMNTYELHRIAQELSERSHCQLEALELFDLEKKGLSLLVSVGQAGQSPPKLLCLSYNGSGRKDPEYTALVGKGVVFDSGGQNIKKNKIDLMKLDMGGAATVLGVFDWVSSQQLPIDLLVVVPLAHNAIGSSSYFPGDVYSSYSGRSVCVKNTDAEGRLILADAISYAIDQYPVKRLLTIATLTMAVIVSLEHQAAGLMGSDENLLESLENSSDKTGERVWRLPSYTEFQDSMKGDISDLNNISSMGGYAGSSTAGAFLSHFTEGLPWVHLDIAGMAFLMKKRHYNGPEGTGFGVRLLSDWLTQFQENS